MRILEALVNAKVLIYLYNIIRDYFRDRVVFAQTPAGMVRKEMTCGVPQGSVLGPLQWNIAFNDIPKEKVSAWVSIIWYVDDTLVVTAEDDIPMLKVNAALEAMTHWIESAGLSLAGNGKSIDAYRYLSILSTINKYRYFSLVSISISIPITTWVQSAMWVQFGLVKV